MRTLKLTIEGEAKEIAALLREMAERREDDSKAVLDGARAILDSRIHLLEDSERRCGQGKG